MLGQRELNGASCWIRMMPELPMQLRDNVRLVHNLQTDKGMRGKGQGTKLLQSVCEEADKKHKILILMPDNDKLEKWYNKFQFERTQDNPVLMMRQPTCRDGSEVHDGRRIN